MRQEAMNQHSSRLKTPRRQNNLTSAQRRNYQRNHVMTLKRKKVDNKVTDVDVDIAGLRQIINRSRSLWWRILWTVISAITLIACAYQCEDRIRYFLSDPSDIHTYYIENKTITFPSVTLCPWSGYDKIPSFNLLLYKRRFGNDTSRTAEDLLKTGNISILDLWEAASIHANSTEFGSYTVGLKKRKPKEQSTDDGHYQIIDSHTVYGKCTTFIASGNVRHSGVQSDQHILVTGDNMELEYFIIKHHSSEQTDLMKYITYNTGIIYTFESWDFFLRVTELIYRNTRQNPCTNDVVAINKCVLECIERAVYSTADKKCRLPYMQENDDISPCKTAEEFKNVVEATSEVVGTFQKADCNCPKQCKEVIYSTEFVGYSDARKNKTRLRLWMGFSESRITVIKEVEAYSGFALFSDLGGSIGLYLGISALQILEILVASFDKLSKQRRKNSS